MKEMFRKVIEMVAIAASESASAIVFYEPKILKELYEKKKDQKESQQNQNR